MMNNEYSLCNKINIDLINKIKELNDKGIKPKKDNKKYYTQLVNEINHMFDDVPFTKQNNFSIIITYDPIQNCHNLDICMTIYDGKLMQDYYDPFLLVPFPTVFHKTIQFFEKFHSTINGYRFEQYLIDLEDFIRRTKNEFIYELKKDRPRESIKMDKITEKDTEEYAYHAKRIWEEYQVGRPIFIVLLTDLKYSEIGGYFNTFKEAKEALIDEVNKNNGKTIKEYSIHSISYPIPPWCRMIETESDLDDYRKERENEKKINKEKISRNKKTD